MISGPQFRGRFGLIDLLLPDRALVIPGFVYTVAGRTFPWCVPIALGWAIPGRMLLRAVAACYCCLALGSYVAIFVILEALSHAALSVIEFALEHLALPNEVLINNFIRIFRSCELDHDRRC